MFDFINRHGRFNLSVLKVYFVIERLVNNNMHILVDRRADDAAGMLQVKLAHIAAAADKADPERCSNADHDKILCLLVMNTRPD